MKIRLIAGREGEEPCLRAGIASGNRDTMASLIGRNLGGYLIEQEVGRGAMGVVFKAKQLSMDRYVALKFLPKRLAQDERIVARFQREARTAGQLSHPNLVNVHDTGVVDGLHFIAMEFVDGSSVHQIVRERGPYSEKETLNIAAQVAAALKAAHVKGILHRDVKPDNFLIDATGRVRLADLGLARFQHEDKSSNATHDGDTVGTPYYMSPEQCSGSNLDERSDLYSLGASMYVLATGHTAFEAPNPAAVLVKTVTQPPRPLKQLNPKLSSGFVALVEKMMAKDPAKRFQNAPEVLEALERCKRGLYRAITKEQVKVEDVPLIPLGRTPRYKLLLYGAAAALTILVVAALIGRARSQRAPASAGADAGSTEKAGHSAAPVAAQTSAKTDSKAGPAAQAKAEPKTQPPKKEEVGAAPRLPSALAESSVMDEQRLAVFKQLTLLKKDWSDKINQNPDQVIAGVLEFQKQHPKVANMADDFLANAKEIKEKLEKDWSEAKGAAEEQVQARHKPEAFHILRNFVDAHEGTRQASIALGMMEGWVSDLHSAARKTAEAGDYETAIEMLTIGDSKLPDEITAQIKKDLAQLAEEHKKFLSFAEADHKKLAGILVKAGSAAREADAAGKRYDFEESAKICHEGLAQLKTFPVKKELEGLEAIYSRAAQVLVRMRLALESLKSVELQGLGKWKEAGQLLGWDEHGLLFKPKDLVQEQKVPWSLVTAENLLQIAQALRIASGGKSATDLLDLGILAFAAGANTVALEKLEQAIAVDPATRPLARPVLRILKPGPTPAEREMLARRLFTEATAAREKNENEKVLSLQKRLLGELSNTTFVQKRLKEVHDLGVPRVTETPASPAEKVEKKDEPAAKKDEKKDDSAAKKDEKKDEPAAKKDEKKDEPAAKKDSGK